MPSDRNGRSSLFFLPNSGKVHWGSPSKCKFELHFLGPTNGTVIVFAMCFYVPKEGIGVTNHLSFFFTLFVALSCCPSVVGFCTGVLIAGWTVWHPPPPIFKLTVTSCLPKHLLTFFYLHNISAGWRELPFPVLQMRKLSPRLHSHFNRDINPYLPKPTNQSPSLPFFHSEIFQIYKIENTVRDTQLLSIQHKK